MIKPAIAAASLVLVAAAPSPRVFVLGGSAAAALLHQCSRAAPAPGQAWFRPTPVEISALEDAVAARSPTAPGMVPQDHVTFRNVADLRARYEIEVAGIVRDGRRYVYGNFVPTGASRARLHPTIVCDGGMSFFGVEYDVAARRITRYDSNGSI